jgi:hypothetical protein
MNQTDDVAFFVHGNESSANGNNVFNVRNVVLIQFLRNKASTNGGNVIAVRKAVFVQLAELDC